jgi:hypothetical protein
MTEEDLKIVSELVNKVRNGTQVKIYDYKGNLNCFALENVMDILADAIKPAISHIFVIQNNGCFSELNYDNASCCVNCTKITVNGSVEKWKKLLKFDNTKVLNCD